MAAESWFIHEGWDGPCEVSATDVIDIIVSQPCAEEPCSQPTVGAIIDRRHVIPDLRFLCKEHLLSTEE